MQSTPAAIVPPKRRRKAPNNGAAEDCFTCRKRQTKCDRRRPYCSQCLDIGKECSGYRTTLTWGVGVASRGKLRGLSLPIPNSGPRATKTQNARKKKSCKSTSTSKGIPPTPTVAIGTGAVTNPICQKQPDIEFNQFPPSPESLCSGSLALPGSCDEEFASYVYGTSATSPVSIQSVSTPPSAWNGLGGEQQQEYQRYRPFRPAHQLHRLRTSTSLTAPYDKGLMSAASIGSPSAYSDSDLSFPQTPEECHMMDQLSQSYSGYNFQQQQQQQQQQKSPISLMESPPMLSVPRSFPSVEDESASAMPASYCSPEYVDSSLDYPDSLETADFRDIPSSAKIDPTSASAEYMYSTDSTQPFDLDGITTNNLEGIQYSSGPHMMSNMYTTCPSSKPLSPRVSYLLDYYDKILCPPLVAYDRESNLYRMNRGEEIGGDGEIFTRAEPTEYYSPAA